MEPFTEDAVALLKEVYASPGLQKKGLKLNEAQERAPRSKPAGGGAGGGGGGPRRW